MYSVYAILLGAVLAGAAFLSGAKINGVVMNESGVHVISTEKHTINKNNLSAFNSIELDVDKANVSLVPSDHYGANFVYYGDNNNYSCSVENGTLKISANEYYHHQIACFDITPFALNNTLKIYYPKNIKFKNLKINNEDGSFDSAGFTADSTDFSLPYGSLNISNAQCGKMGIDLQSGKCELKNVKATALDYQNDYGSGTFEDINIGAGQNVKMLSKDGSLALKNFSCGKLELQNNYGNISLDSVKVSSLKSTLKDGKMSVKNSSIENSVITNSYGMVSFDGVRSNGTTIDCQDGEISVNGELKGKTQLSSDYGKVSVKTSLPKDKYSYTAVTKYGNVEIDGKKLGMNISNGGNAENTIYAEAKDGDVSVTFGSR